MDFMKRFDLKGKNILITGGAQGIGKCVAEALASCGANIGIVDLQGDAAAKTVEQIRKEYKVKVSSFKCNVTDSVAVDRTISAFAAYAGGLDAVFNNAGIVMHAPAEKVSDEDWKSVIDVNLNGVFYVARAAAKQFMKEGKKGSIVNTASMSGLIVNLPQCQAAYNTSKAAVIHLTKTLAVEWADKGIRVNSISPGYIRTEMTAAVREEWRKYWEDLIPFKRMGTPEELAGAVIYLMSDASTYTSGLNMVVDGAFTCI